MQQNNDHQHTIELNDSIEYISAGRIRFRSDTRVTTIVNRGQENEVTVRADGNGQVTLSSAGISYIVSIGIQNAVTANGLLLANIRVNGVANEIKFNDNWVLNQDGLRNERLNQGMRRIPLTLSPVLHIQYRVNAFDFVGANNFISVRSMYGFPDYPVALHLMHNGLLDVIWHPVRSVDGYLEYIHELYYAEYQRKRNDELAAEA